MAGVASPRLQALLSVGRLFPDMRDTLEHVTGLFDRSAAREQGSMTPTPGAVRGRRERSTEKGDRETERHGETEPERAKGS